MERFLYNEFHAIYVKNSRVEVVIGCLFTDSLLQEIEPHTVNITFQHYKNAKTIS